MAVKKQKIDPRAVKLKDLKEQISALQNVADGLRKDLLKDYAEGAHPGFTISIKYQQRLSAELLEQKLGDLTPFKVATPATYLEFTKTS